jgi:hypothetical protein
MRYVFRWQKQGILAHFLNLRNGQPCKQNGLQTTGNSLSIAFVSALSIYLQMCGGRCPSTQIWQIAPQIEMGLCVASDK